MKAWRREKSGEGKVERELSIVFPEFFLNFLKERNHMNEMSLIGLILLGVSWGGLIIRHTTRYFQTREKVYLFYCQAHLYGVVATVSILLEIFIPEIKADLGWVAIFFGVTAMISIFKAVNFQCLAEGRTLSPFVIGASIIIFLFVLAVAIMIKTETFPFLYW